MRIENFFEYPLRQDKKFDIFSGAYSGREVIGFVLAFACAETDRLRGLFVCFLMLWRRGC